jgi:hypothetical protein
MDLYTATFPALASVPTSRYFKELGAKERFISAAGTEETLAYMYKGQKPRRPHYHSI